ncbi:MAG TPA: hypothetical protein VL294_12270 [Pseudolysinimonas sp.]|jgi:hypothetical protein|nr:hypothetical protein [Pseudolysinimonas sp.]
MRNPWILAQLAVAAVLLIVSLIGIIGTVGFDAAELVFSFAGGIQAFGVFPGLVISLVVNALLLRRPQPLGVAVRVLLGIEFALIASLVVYHFYTDPAGTTFGLAVITWVVVIPLAVAIAIVALVRRAAAPAATPAAPVPAPPAP